MIMISNERSQDHYHSAQDGKKGGELLHTNLKELITVIKCTHNSVTEYTRLDS